MSCFWYETKFASKNSFKDTSFILLEVIDERLLRSNPFVNSDEEVGNLSLLISVFRQIMFCVEELFGRYIQQAMISCTFGRDHVYFPIPFQRVEISLDEVAFMPFEYKTDVKCR